MYRQSTSLGRTILATALAVFAADAFADVSVKGHYRGGKWIAPHHRSSPNGIFADNWSTKGNQNPYTGKRGTLVTPPKGYGGSRGYVASYSDEEFGSDGYAGDRVPGESAAVKREAERKARLAAIAVNREARKKREAERQESLSIELAARGVDVAGQNGLQLQHTKFKLVMADGLEREGLPVDWESLTAYELNDLKNRIALTKSLKIIGHEVSWRDYSGEELLDMLRRIKLAEYVKRAQPGRRIDWQKYTAAELSKMSVEGL